ncbi:unnamed protein product [marine sediment metagenome]|uniref:Uncharacterized protein n=1 Tax=marine sediment metagenome TaxID=412755 RepID=X1P5Y3_9ZZZZ
MIEKYWLWEVWPFIFLGVTLVMAGVTIGDILGNIMAVSGVLVCVFSIVCSVRTEVSGEHK